MWAVLAWLSILAHFNKDPGQVRHARREAMLQFSEAVWSSVDVGISGEERDAVSPFVREGVVSSLPRTFDCAHTANPCLLWPTRPLGDSLSFC